MNRPGPLLNETTDVVHGSNEEEIVFVESDDVEWYSEIDENKASRCDNTLKHLSIAERHDSLGKLQQQVAALKLELSTEERQNGNLRVEVDNQKSKIAELCKRLSKVNERKKAELDLLDQKLRDGHASSTQEAVNLVVATLQMQVENLEDVRADTIPMLVNTESQVHELQEIQQGYLIKIEVLESFLEKFDAPEPDDALDETRQSILT